jgi:hypothetical protein
MMDNGRREIDKRLRVMEAIAVDVPVEHATDSGLSPAPWGNC